MVTGRGCAVIFSGVWILGAARWREVGTHHSERVLRQIFRTVRWQFGVEAMVNGADADVQPGKFDRIASERN